MKLLKNNTEKIEVLMNKMIKNCGYIGLSSFQRCPETWVMIDVSKEMAYPIKDGIPIMLPEEEDLSMSCKFLFLQD